MFHFKFHRLNLLLVSAGLAVAVMSIGALGAEATKELMPVTVKVLANDSGAPVPEFAYQYWIGEPRISPENWITNRSADGAFVIAAPASGEITIGIQTPVFEAGQAIYDTHSIKTSDVTREIVIRLKQGFTVRGKVLDLKTKQPVAGALVAPIEFHPPLFTPEWSLAVTSSASGEFELRVRDFMGLGASHPDYLISDEFVGSQPGNQPLINSDVLLEKGEVFVGRVVDPNGTAVAGVQISDGAGKSALTDKDGAFVIRSPKKWWTLTERFVRLRGFAKRLGIQKLVGLEQPIYQYSYYFTFEKDDYIPLTLYPTKAPGKGMRVVLQPMPIVRGVVVGADGRPVTDFEVAGGPGTNPASYERIHEVVHNAQGQFSIKFALEETNWFCVKASGLAFWEGHVTKVQLAKPLAIQLPAGVTVTGKLDRGNRGGKAEKLILVPARRTPGSFIVVDSTSLALTELTGVVQADDIFKFPGVRPDNYFLRLTADGRRIREWMFSVPAHDINVGRVSVESSPTSGNGRLAGRIFHPPRDGIGVPWEFAKGELSWTDQSREQATQFKADENGHFSLESIPAGTVMVSIPFWATADIRDAHVRLAKVVPKRATEVNFFGTNDAHRAVFQFIVGDGSPQQFAIGTGANAASRAPSFNVELTPLDDEPASWPEAEWEELDAQRQIVLPGVTPARYRVRIFNWNGSIAMGRLVYETVVGPIELAQPIRIRLPSASVSGWFTWNQADRHNVDVWALPAGHGARTRQGFAQNDSGFILRHVESGNYTLFAHDSVAGWRRVDHVRVAAGTINEVGNFQLLPGGRLEGRILAPALTSVPDSLEIKSPEGILVEPERFEAMPGGEYSVGSLWPGRWTVSLLTGTNALATTNVTFVGRENIRVNLVP